MKGKDLIIYILQNDLDDKPINQIISGLLCTDAEYAANQRMGVESVRVLYSLGKIRGTQIDGKLFIFKGECNEKN